MNCSGNKTCSDPLCKLYYHSFPVVFSVDDYSNLLVFAVQNMRNTHLQVWPLPQFFLFPSCEKSLICLEGKSMTPHRGKTILFRSSQQLPLLRLGPSKGFLRCPSRTLDSPRALLPELQRYKDTVRCAALGAEVPGHRQKQLTQTFILCLLKMHLFSLITT